MPGPIEAVFPPPETALEIEPEELAFYILKVLQEAEDRNDKPLMNRHNFSLAVEREYTGSHASELARAAMEAWMWLETEIMIAHRPGETNWFFVTRRGREIASRDDMSVHVEGRLLPRQSLNPVLAKEVRPLFLRGDYDTAVFRAFKEVEVRVRKIAKLSQELIGVRLMREAFKPGSGPLADSSLEGGEQQAMSDLFAGAIGSFKNPSSHRYVDFAHPSEAAEAILLANHLLRVVGRRAQRTGEEE